VLVAGWANCTAENCAPFNTCRSAKAKTGGLTERVKSPFDVINSEPATMSHSTDKRAFHNQHRKHQRRPSMAIAQILIMIGFFSSLIFVIQALVPVRNSHPIA
jgi:hypothetical protein